MKNIVTIALFVFLAVVGYYVGVAVANDHNTMQEPTGVMVVEEEYDVIAVPQNQQPNQPKNKETVKKDSSKHIPPAGQATNNGGGMMVEEEISETEN